MAPDDALELLRECDGEQEVVTRQQFVLLFLKPVFGLVVLACRTVSVSAGAGDGMCGTALVRY